MLDASLPTRLRRPAGMCHTVEFMACTYLVMMYPPQNPADHAAMSSPKNSAISAAVMDETQSENRHRTQRRLRNKKVRTGLEIDQVKVDRSTKAGR